MRRQSPRYGVFGRAVWFSLFGLGMSMWIAPVGWSFQIPVEKHRVLVDITLTSAFEFHSYNPNTQRSAHAFNYFDLQNKLNLALTVDNFRFGGRVDTYNFFDDRAPCPEKSPDCKGLYIPEKIYLKYRVGAIDFVAGDFYLTIGRGIALSIRKVDEFGLDTTLRGGRITIEHETFQAIVASGFVNTTNFDPIQEIPFSDPHHFIFAVRASNRFFDLFTLGAHYVWIDASDKPDTSGNSLVNRSQIVGGSIEFARLFNRVDIYLEGDALFQEIGTLSKSGYALYTGVNGYFFPFTLQLEGQWYNRFRLQADLNTPYSSVLVPPLVYNYPPSMERQDLDTQGDNVNSKGVRVRLDYTLPSRKTVFHLNYLFRYGFIDSEKGEPLNIHHVYAGVEHRFGEWGQLVASGGYRDIAGFENWRLAHADIDFNVHFAERHGMELIGRYWWNHKFEHLAGVPVEQTSNYFHLLDLQLSYAWSKVLNLALMFSYTDEIKAEEIRRVYIAGEVKVFLWSYGYLKFLVGNTRGGLRCISGVCRTFPPFEGVRGEITIRL